MRMNLKSLEDKQKWKEMGFKLPDYNVEKMIENTANNPEWIHFGAGNIFRAFPAVVCQHLLNSGIMNTGIVVAEGYDYEIIEKSFKNYDNLTAAVTLKADGTIEKEIVASIAEALCVDSNNEKDWDRLNEIFKAESLKMVSFTITEKGYSLVRGNGEMLPDVKEDMENGPENVHSYIGKLVSLLYTRYKSGEKPITLVSMDNCSHNGTKLQNAVLAFVKTWTENGKAQEGFLDYAKNKVSYPWSMIDKITPRPADAVIDMLKEVGFEDTEAVVTSKNTFVAPFVNAEETQYLVIEDDFKNGKLPLDKGGIIYTTRNTVDKVEKMKVCTCLNPLHTALAVYGCVLGYTKICDEMKDENLVTLIKNAGYKEGLPVVTDPGILSPKEFIDTVVEVRLPNPFMPDAPQRIACDTSQKVGIRFGETIKAYMKEGTSDKLEYIPLVLAGWLRYLMAKDDNGDDFELSPDPLIPELTAIMSEVKFGDNSNADKAVAEILERKDIFGADLKEAGLDKKILAYFKELNGGKGAVRTTLKKYC